MLLLEWSQGCYGRTDGSVTISLRNFVDEWMTDNVRRDAFILSCSHLSMLHSPISLVNPLNYSPGEGLDPLTSPISLVNPLNYSPGEGLDPLTSPILLVNSLNYSPGEGLDPSIILQERVWTHQLFSRRGFGPINYSPGEGLDPLTSLTLPHVCACPKQRPGFPTSYVMVFFLSLFMIWSEGRLFVLLILVGLLTITFFRLRLRFMVFNATFNDISVISWLSVLLVE